VDKRTESCGISVGVQAIGKEGRMLFLDKYANAEQLKIFAQPTTDFFGAQHIVINRDVAMTALTSQEEGSRLRPEVIKSLERSLKEHADIWAELANY